MTTTMRGIRRKMLALVPDLGRVAPVTALAAQSATAARLGGGVSAQKWVNYWMLRSEAATAADRNQRYASSYNGASGAFTHTGTAYADTTITSEYLEIHKYEPQLIDAHINEALAKTVYRHRDIIPVREGVTKHWLTALDWIQDTGDISAVAWTYSPVLSRNRFFETWLPDTAGGFAPDGWTLSGAAATVERVSTPVWRGPYMAAVTRAGTDALLTQSVGVLQNGVSARTLRGKTITLAGAAYATVADRARFRVYENGTATASTAYHTGGSTVEQLTTTVTIADTTDTLTFGFSVDTGDTTAYAGEAFIADQPISDAKWINDYPETAVIPEYDQNALALVNPPMGRSGQWVIYSWRNYPPFDATRVLDGTADTDQTDADVDTVACGALAQLFRGMGDPAYTYWNSRWEGMQRKGLYVPSARGGGANVIPNVMMAPAVARR